MGVWRSILLLNINLNVKFNVPNLGTQANGNKDVNRRQCVIMIQAASQVRGQTVLQERQHFTWV